MLSTCLVEPREPFSIPSEMVGDEAIDVPSPYYDEEKFIGNFTDNDFETKLKIDEKTPRVFKPARMPPKPIGETFNPKLDITKCKLPPPQTSIPINLSSRALSFIFNPNDLIEDLENSQENLMALNRGVFIKAENSLASLDTSNTCVYSEGSTGIGLPSIHSLSPTPEKRKKKHHHHHQSINKDKSSDLLVSPQRSLMGKRGNTIIPVAGRKSAGAWKWAKQVEEDLALSQYDSVNVGVPAFVPHNWKYPSGYPRGTRLSPVYEKFVLEQVILKPPTVF